jgi:hypothetical protein
MNACIVKAQHGIDQVLTILCSQSKIPRGHFYYDKEGLY